MEEIDVLKEKLEYWKRRCIAAERIIDDTRNMPWYREDWEKIKKEIYERRRVQ